MTHKEISILRLQNQHFQGGHLQSAAELVHHFGAVQAQEYEQTKWGLGLRLPALDNTDIEKEIESGIIRRTHLLRPTWHLVHANDILWLQALTSGRVQAVNKFMYRQLDLTDKLLDRAAAIICRSLEAGESLTRPELAAILSRNRINAAGLRMVYIMMNVELKGYVANGKRKGKQHTYSLIRPGSFKTPKTKTSGKTNSTLPGKEECLLHLTQRYFNSRGPATVKDFSTWSGLTMAQCRVGLNLNAGTLDQFKLEDQVYYHNPSLMPAHKNAVDSEDELFLLPIYDELIMGYRNREAIMQNLTHGQRYTYDCMILYKGQVCGTYKRTIAGKTAVFEFDYFKSPGKKEQRLVKNAMKKFEDFSGLKATVAQP